MAFPGVMNPPRLEGSSHNRERESEEICKSQKEGEQICMIEIEKQHAVVKPHQRGRSIFAVPRSLRKLEPDAYVPHVVSIGPYHRKEEHLKEMEKHKRQVLKHVLERTKLPLDRLVNLMSRLEEDPRNSYDKPIEGFSNQQFMEMMLLDACFILELLLYSSYGNVNRSYYTSEWWDPIIIRGFLPFIQRDLLMLENQLPLSVLVCLIEFIYSAAASCSGPCGPSQSTWDADLGTTSRERVANLALRFFQPVIQGISETPPKYTMNENLPLHLLDIVHQFLKPAKENCKEQDEHPHKHNTQIPSHSVTKLRGTGISFKKGGSPKITDIDFKDKKLLTIPPIHIDLSTKSMFLNLMAFEQCYPHCGSHITSYISFMDGLIDCAKDVVHLQKKGIIVLYLGSEDDVAALFNNLRKEIAFPTSDYYLANISCDLNSHYTRWRNWSATLKHVYFKDPWKIISIVAATFLILLTLAQTVYTIVGYHLPNP